ncbi:MAG TPA: metal ABC transporter ATP-binding protein [Planctomycetota bacterium]|nr:metal ABC transporter ATP-binding protein [Planctomycetota bacterium]
MSEALIRLNNLSIGYDHRPVLSGISLAIMRGSFSALLGTNGSGKSTLLKTLLGLLTPVAGRVEIEASADAPVVFGYVPQTTVMDPLYPLTGFDVALMGVYGRVGAGKRVPSAEREFVRECLGATNSLEFCGQRFSELSGGQKQRVLIARALATRATILVLDEPTSGLDSAATHSLLEFISKIHGERKLTTILVSHDLGLVRKHAQQIIWLHQGKVLQGSVGELLTPERMAEIFELEMN